MQVHFIGHSAVELKLSQMSVLIDPFITGNPVALQKPEDFSPSHILLSHAHGDHLGDSESIAKRSNATIVSCPEIVNYFNAKGLKGHGMNVGGSFLFPFGKLSFTPAWHSSSLPDGSYGGMPMGIVVEAEGKRIYHAGDTALFSDMLLLARSAIDLAFLPIGDNYTMGPKDALEAVKLLKPKQLVPIHYNTFDVIKQDALAFKNQVEQETDTQVVILMPGDKLELS
jgi:L-ascorbate metabolism protein UlaG (beta-lactamase superfamily)